MARKCIKCGTVLGEEDPTVNGSCADCFTDAWAEIIIRSPMVSPNILLRAESAE